MIKLNVGSNQTILEGFINVDIVPHPNVAVVADAKELPYKDGEVDEILSSHLIEHFDYFDGQKALKEWARVLKPGGILTIECPNFEAFCRKFLELPEQERPNYYVQVWGYPWEAGQAHKFGYTPNQLVGELYNSGFSQVQQIPSFRYTNIADWNMAFICIK